MKLRRATFLTALVLVGALVACAKSLSDLEPFPCAKNGSCPADFTCLPDGCHSGHAIDESCGDIACAVGDCIGGTCLPHCNGTSCAPGRVCSFPPSTAAIAPLGELPAYCVLDCSSAPCPSGLKCSTIYGNTKACVSDVATAPIDEVCSSSADCQGLFGTYLPLLCVDNTCAPYCSTDAPCGDPARSCSVTKDPVKNGCLFDCSDAGVACPRGLACTDGTVAPGRRACVSPPK